MYPPAYGLDRGRATPPFLHRTRRKDPFGSVDGRQRPLVCFRVSARIVQRTTAGARLSAEVAAAVMFFPLTTHVGMPHHFELV